jgi:hypothetical protein
MKPISVTFSGDEVLERFRKDSATQPSAHPSAADGVS